jgi:hypothetical protein
LQLKWKMILLLVEATRHVWSPYGVLQTLSQIEPNAAHFLTFSDMAVTPHVHSGFDSTALELMRNILSLTLLTILLSNLYMMLYPVELN